MSFTWSNTPWVTVGAMLLAGWGLTGCGSSETPAPTPTAQSSAPPAVTAAKSTSTTSDYSAATATPDGTVKAFLSAIKQGDDKQAEAMLTDIARQRTRERDLYVAPPGTESASYEVGEFEIEEDKAQVASTWTDLGQDGQPHTEVIVWLLRKEKGAWQIAGLATNVAPGAAPLILNFEDPDDMLFKLESADAGRQGTQAARTASKPADPNSTEKQ